MRRASQSSAGAARSSPHALGAAPSHTTAAAAAAAPSCAAAAAPSAPAVAPAAAASNSRRSSSKAAGAGNASAGGPSSVAGGVTGALKPVMLPRSDWRLTEEVRCVPLGDCMQYNDAPFLWLCATGNVAELANMLAIERADRDRRRRLLESKRRRGQSLGDDADPDAEETYLTQADESGWSCVHWAAAFDQRAVLQLLYDAFLQTLPSHLRPADSTPLPQSQLQTADFLHPIYLFINRPTLALDTPLHVAAYNCHSGTMDWLLQHGADIHARNMEEGSTCLGQTPLMCVAEKKTQRLARARQADAARFLLGYIRRMELAELDDDEDDTPEQRNVDAQLRQLTLEQLSLTRPQQLPVYFTAEEDAQQQQRQQRVTFTTAHYPGDDDTKSEAKFVETKSEPMEEAVQPSQMGGAAAATAISDELDAKELLKEEVRSFNAGHETAHGQHFRSESPTRKSSAAATISGSLLASMSCINSTRSSGSTALMMAAFSGNLELVQELLSHGALVDLTIFDVRGRRVMDSALLNAVDEGHLPVARLLLQWGADRTMQNSAGETSALMVCQSDAECYRRDEQLRVSFLTLLCEEGVDSASSFALKSFLLNQCDHGGVSPLLWAVRRGCLSVVQWLVAMGADASQPDPATNSTIVQQLIHKITRSKEKSRYKKSDHAMALMLDFFLSEPSCAQYVADVSSDLREYVADMVQQAREAEEAAATAAAAALAAVPVRKRSRPSVSVASNVARSASSKSSSKRTKHAPVAPSTPSSKTSASRSGSGRDRHNKPKAAAASPRRAAPPPKLASASRSSSNPLSTAAPPRFFKGGKQTHSHAGRPSASRAASDNEGDSRDRAVPTGGKQYPAHSDGSDDGMLPYDELGGCSSDGEQSFDAHDIEEPPAPTPTALPAGRIQGTLAKMQAAPVLSAAQLSGLDPIGSQLDGSSSSLNGELNSESQVALDDHMELSQPSQPMHGQDHSHDSATSAAHSASLLALPMSPLKYSPARSGGMGAMLLAKSPTPSLFSPDVSGVSLAVAPFKEMTMGMEPMLRVQSDMTAHGHGPSAVEAAAGGHSHNHSHIPFLGMASFPSHVSVASSSSYMSPAVHSGSSVAASARVSPPPSSFALVASTLTQLHMAEFLQNFITNSLDDSLLSILAQPDNDDMLRELIPPAGPRMKLRQFLRDRALTGEQGQPQA